MAATLAAAMAQRLSVGRSQLQTPTGTAAHSKARFLADSVALRLQWLAEGFPYHSPARRPGELLEAASALYSPHQRSSGLQSSLTSGDLLLQPIMVEMPAPHFRRRDNTHQGRGFTDGQGEGEPISTINVTWTQTWGLGKES